MSTVKITFSTQVRPSSPIYGTVQLNLLLDGIAYPINLELHPFGGYQRFREVVFFSPKEASDGQQAANYASSMNRDYSLVGGFSEDEGTGFTGSTGGGTFVRNITASSSGDEVTIIAEKGEFQNGSYTGNVLESVSFEYDNVAQLPSKTFVFEPTGNGDCDIEEFRATQATGGTAPYSLILGGSTFISGWSGGTERIFNLTRVKTFSGALYDDNGQLIKTVQINPTKKIHESNFSVDILPFVGYADIKVITEVPKAGTTPLQYNLSDENDVEIGWQNSDTFPNVIPGNYTVKIRDRYLCEVSKDINIADISSPLESDRVDYFKISEFNSLSFFNEVEHGVDVRKNYENTPSWCEDVPLSKIGVFRFPETKDVPTQFKSTYPYHRVTLFRKGFSNINLPFLEIQRNLGVSEKVDCVLFPVQQEFQQIDGGTVVLNEGTGVYFSGGVQYVPGTNTPKGDPDSPYDGGLPGWAQVGNIVNIDGEGSFEIIETDIFDEDLDVLYFRIAANLGDKSARIQASWDRHPYNVFRVDFSMVDVPEEGAFLRIEPGVLDLNGDLLVDITKIHRSEWILRLDDESKYLKIQWSAFRNIGEMLFIDGIQSEMWLKGRIRPFSDTSSSSDDADDRTRSVDQSAFLRMRAFFPLLTPRQWRKLDLVGSIGSRGTVFIQDMELVRIETSENEEIEQTNLSSVNIGFAYSGESTAIGQEDPVYSLETGFETSASPENGREVIGWEADGNRLVSDDGSFVKVTDENGSEKFVEIPD